MHTLPLGHPFPCPPNLHITFLDPPRPLVFTSHGFFSNASKCLSVGPVSRGQGVRKHSGMDKNVGGSEMTAQVPCSLHLCALRDLLQASYDIREKNCKAFEVQPKLSFLLHFIN